MLAAARGQIAEHTSTHVHAFIKQAHPACLRRAGAVRERAGPLSWCADIKVHCLHPPCACLSTRSAAPNPRCAHNMALPCRPNQSRKVSCITPDQTASHPPGKPAAARAITKMLPPSPQQQRRHASTSFHCQPRPQRHQRVKTSHAAAAARRQQRPTHHNAHRGSTHNTTHTSLTPSPGSLKHGALQTGCLCHLQGGSCSFCLWPRQQQPHCAA